MKTIRKCVFETNSSSCHVLTIMSEDEVAKLKSGECVIKVNDYHAHDEEPADSDVMNKDDVIEMLYKRKISKKLPLLSEYVNYVFKHNSLNADDFCTEHNIQGKNAEQYREVDYILSDCLHDESIGYILNEARIKTINGTKVYVSVWEKCC